MGSRIVKAGPDAVALTGLLLCAGVALSGCVAPYYSSEARIQAASRRGTGPLTIAQRQIEPLSDLERLGQSVSYSPYYERETHETYDGSDLLRDAVVTDATIDELVKTRGVPDAIEMNSALLARWLILYYKDPPQSYDFVESPSDVTNPVNNPRHHSRLVFTMNDVPRSVRRIGFGEGPLPPPWPVTISSFWKQSFGVPALGGPAPQTIDGQGWARLANSLTGETARCRGSDAERSKRLFTALAQANQVAGLLWRIIPFDSPIPSGFGVPDGTIFVSCALIESLKDDELTAVFAHLMGHERYQHYPSNVETAETMRMAVAPGSIPPEVPKFPEVLTTPPYAYTRWQEIEANRAAVKYLAMLDIPPDVLFDALYKLTAMGSETSFQMSAGWPSFNAVHHAWRNDADLGKLLDAGDVNHTPPIRVDHR